MNIGPVEYSFINSDRWVIAVIDDIKWEQIDLHVLSDLSSKVNWWIEQGNTPTPCATGRELPSLMRQNQERDISHG